VAIKLKTPDEIECMRRAGRVVRQVLNRIGEIIAPGVETIELDRQAEQLCLRRGARCLFKGVPCPGNGGPFPGSICASINEEVVHGIPQDREIRDGDIVSIDFGVELDGWCGDAAATFLVGDVDSDVQRLVSVTRNALSMAIEMCRPGEVWSTMARAMQEYVESQGFSVVREYVGHGIGRSMHEEPKVPNFFAPDLKRRDIPLCEGLVLAVEPMVNLGAAAVMPLSDGWTVVTKDRKASAHFEETVAIVEGGVAVLTAEE